MTPLVIWISVGILAIVAGVACERLGQIRDELARIGDKLQAILNVIEKERGR